MRMRNAPLVQSALENRSQDEEIQLTSCSSTVQRAMSEILSKAIHCMLCQVMQLLTLKSCLIRQQINDYEGLSLGFARHSGRRRSDWIERDGGHKAFNPNDCRAVVDDLLNTFLGVDGRYIRAQVVKRAEGLHLTFTLTTAMDPSIRDLAKRLLPLRYLVYLQKCLQVSCEQ